MRNINDYEIMGRKLRVDFSHEDGVGENAPSGHQAPPPGAMPGPPPTNAPNQSTLPPLPPGVDLPPNLTCPDAISRTLSTLPAPQLLDLLAQMKGLVMTDPNRASELLRTAPQLSYAIFQALLLMGLVDTSVLGQVVEQAQTQQAPSQQMPPAPQAPPYQQFQPMLQQSHVPTPPIQQQAYAPPPPPQAPPQAAPMSQEELIRQVLAMPQHQIDAMPPNERSQLMALRQSMGAGGY